MKRILFVLFMVALGGCGTYYPKTTTVNCPDQDEVALGTGYTNVLIAADRVSNGDEMVNVYPGCSILVEITAAKK